MVAVSYLFHYGTILHNTTGITKCDSYFIITKCESFSTKCDNNYKMRTLLRNATSIKKCIVTMRLYIAMHIAIVKMHRSCIVLYLSECCFVHNKTSMPLLKPWKRMEFLKSPSFLLKWKLEFTLKFNISYTNWKLKIES